MARVEDAVRGKPIELPRDDAVVDWTYAADSAQAAWLALTTTQLPHRLYNVRSERRPIGDFARALRRLLPDARIETDQAEQPGHSHPSMDNSRLIGDLGFQPRYSLEAGLRDYIDRIQAYDRYTGRQADERRL
jgi:nucleoside-diphosphate-sugar epimerase